MKTIQEAAKNSFDRLSIAGADTNEADFIGGFKIGVEFAQRWIPIEEELPQHRIAVFVKMIDRNIPILATLNTNDMCWYFYDYSDNEWYGFASVKKITHWRPIERF